MKLNCKPGDLAILIRDICFEHNGEKRIGVRSGMIVRCVRLTNEISDHFSKVTINPDDIGLPAWELEDKPIITVIFSCGCKVTAQLVALNDKVLRPLPSLPDEEEELRLIDLREPA